MKKREIILASTSVVRKWILENAGFEFRTVASGYDEDMNLADDPGVLTRVLALGKANIVAEKFREAMVIGVDSIVCVAEEGVLHKLGKPKDLEEAKEMLRKMSGKVIEVVCGMAVVCFENGFRETAIDVTKVWIAEISEEDVDEYLLNNDEVLSAAGGLMLEKRGAKLVEKIEGDFFAVLGVSVFKVSRLLKKCGGANGEVRKS